MTTVGFSKFTNAAGLMAKRYHLRPDGTVEKTSAAQMYEGSVETVTLALAELPALLAGLKSNEAIGLGICDLAPAPVVTAAKQPNAPGAVARTQEFFHFPAGHALGFIDADGIDAPDQLNEAIVAACPAFDAAAKIIFPSSSAGIYRTGEDKPVATSTGLHCYFTVRDGTDLARFGAVLCKRLWLTGHGYIEIGDAGQKLVRQTIDANVFSPERIIFEAQPIVGKGLERRPPAPTLIDGGILDTTLCPDLSPEEEAEYQRLVAEAKAAKEPEAQQVRANYLATRGQEIADAQKIPLADAIRILDRAMEGKPLANKFPLQFQKFGTVTVADVQADLEKFDKQILHDPMEPNYKSKFCAIFYANLAIDPAIFSQAHGGKVYPLQKKKQPPAPAPAAKPAQRDVHPLGQSAFYDQSRREYLIEDRSGGWVALAETGLKRILRQLGLDPRPPRGELVSPLDSRLIEIQTRYNVHFAGPVAGHDAGLHETPDTRYLVTKSPTIIPAAPGQWETIHGILLGMLGPKQLQYLYGWLKCSRAALVSKKFTPGQALAIAGPKDSAKSLFQALITLALGGRSARPYQFMSGQTPFNAHLFAAEHQMIEDESPATDHKARRMLGAMVKSLTVNQDQSCHRKGATPVMLRPFWRLSITVNDEPENLMVLPPLDESLEDKIILLKAERRDMPMPTATPEERDAFWLTLVGELPAFLAHVESFQIPTTMVSQRFGITHYHHPELLAKLDDLSPEFTLLSIIENHLLVGGQTWKGKASDLERIITDKDCPYHYEARKLLSWSTACGTYLSRLRRRHPNQITFAQTGADRERLWTIFPRAG